MMLGAGDLRVTLVTIHEPLANVPALVTEARIIATARITAEALRRDFGIAPPRPAEPPRRANAPGSSLSDARVTGR